MRKQNIASDKAVVAKKLNVSFYLQNTGIDSVKTFILKGLFKKPLRRKQVLFDVDLEVKKGECLGILGRNGSGKTTFLRVLARIIKPDNGYLEVNGQIAPVLALASGLELEMTGYENIKFVSTLMRHDKETQKTINEKVKEFSELSDEELSMQIKRYSSGMIARLAFSIAVAKDPDILIVDEALAVGDLNFRNKCYRRIDEIIANGCTIIFVSQNPEELKKICNRVILLKNGRIDRDGTPDEIAQVYYDMVENNKMR